MTKRLLGALAVASTVVVFVSVDLVAQAPAARTSAVGESWSPPRTPDGQPDISGVWSNATYTPFERPEDLGEREFFTPEEAEALAKRRLDALHNQPRDSIHYDDAIWMSERTPRGMTSLRTSIIVEPKNGRLPPMTDDGRRRDAERRQARQQRGPADSAQTRGLSERCIIWQHEGPPLLPTGYNSNLQIFQGAGYVVVMHEMMGDARVISLDGSPRLGSAIRKYRGDSRGRWEGNTLVVETTNFTDRTAFRGASEHQRVIERFTPVDAETLLYEFTVDDPHTWATPWRGEVPMMRSEDRIYEYACHEGNYGIANILRNQRAEDAAASPSTR
jgi:hypothetical protein